MDWGSLIGLVLGVGGVLLGQVLEGGHIRSLVQPAAFVIVVIGTLGAVILQSGLQTFFRGLRLAQAAFTRPRDNVDLVRNMAFWSATARREGFLSLERYMTVEQDPFVQQGLRLVIDGVDPESMREILHQEITAYEARERQAVRVWEAAGGYSPTIGIIGAVLGLIHVMENLSDPGKLGAGIAVAFVATIYGVGLANLVFLPIGARLRAHLNREVQKREMLTDAFVAIAHSESTRVIEERMLIYRKS